MYVCRYVCCIYVCLYGCMCVMYSTYVSINVCRAGSRLFAIAKGQIFKKNISVKILAIFFESANCL